MIDFAITFARPAALWLLLAVPVIAILGLTLGNRRRGITRLVVGLRVLVVALLIVALADPLLARGGTDQNTIFVVDRSRSIDEQTAAEATNWVMSAIDGADSGDNVSVVTFGGSPVLAQSPTDAADVGRSWSDASLPDGATDATDISSAIAMARALPMGGSRRVVLLSDGAENAGVALDQAQQAAAEGVPIDVVTLPGVGEGDLRVAGLTAPTSTWQGEPFSVLVSVAASAVGPGTVSLVIDGQVAQQIEATFREGISSFQFDISDLPPGFHSLEAQVASTAVPDRYPENNLLPHAVVVRGAPKVLVVAPEGVDSGALIAALQAQGAETVPALPADVPSQISLLGQYDAIVLDNVPASALTLDQHANIQAVVQMLGRGLIVIGGTSAYGPGGYAGSPLEEVLPVKVRVTEGQERQNVAVLFIVDRSGSMTYDPLGGTSKIDMAKQAIQTAATSLSDGDFVGVLAFDDDQQWIVEMMQITGQPDRDFIITQVDTIEPEGGTEIYPALSLGFDAIKNVDADARHVVLLTDGKSRSGTREAYQKLIDEVITENTTLSTIAIGDDADTELLMFLAEQGGGRYHFTDKPEDIPRITLEEAQSAGNQSVVRGDFRVIQNAPSPIMTNLDPELFPPLQGYDFAEPKPGGQVILTSTRTDPLLAKWQYGLGRVVAWTGDDGADFTLGWQSWEAYGPFWMNVVRWALPDPENRPLLVSAEREGSGTVLSVDALSSPGETDTAFGVTTATVTTLSGATVDVELHQSGPGQYEARLDGQEPGAYLVQVTQQRGSDVIEEMAGFALPPSPELQPATGSQELLHAIAAQTGGRVLSLADAPDVFDAAGLSGTALREYDPIWYIPLVVALVTLLAEIGLRTGVLRELISLLRRSGS